MQNVAKIFPSGKIDFFLLYNNLQFASDNQDHALTFDVLFCARNTMKKCINQVRFVVPLPLPLADFRNPPLLYTSVPSYHLDWCCCTCFSKCFHSTNCDTQRNRIKSCRINSKLRYNFCKVLQKSLPPKFPKNFPFLTSAKSLFQNVSKIFSKYLNNYSLISW